MDAAELTAALRGLVPALPQPITVGAGGPAVVALPDDHTVHDLEHLQPRPNRARASVHVTDSRSLSAYLKRFAGPETVIFADYDARRAVAKIDYHGERGTSGVPPSHRQHSATFTARFALAYDQWREAAGKSMTQTAFAEFLEDRMDDIRAPDAATVMEAVMAFSMARKVTFSQSIKLASGMRQLTYREEDEQTKGALQVPERIDLFVPVLSETEPQSLRVDVRYRISSEGKLSFGLHIHDQEAVETEAFDRCVDQIATDHPSIPVFNGTSAG